MNIKVAVMYLAVVQILIIVILIFLTLIVIGVLFWPTSSQSLDGQLRSSNINSDGKIIREVITNDSYLHRLLMIEIISSDKIGSSEGDKNSQCILNEVPSSECSIKRNQDMVSLCSEDFTFKKMSNGIELLGRSLIRSFGGAMSQRIASLMQQRNIIIRNYYQSMRDVVCHNGTCVHVINVSSDDSDTKGSRIIRPLTSTEPFFPSNIIDKTPPIDPSNDERISISSLDITTITLLKLEAVTREIADNIAASFHIRDVDYSTNEFDANRKSLTKRPIIHYERLFNLIIMYDKELLNQAKSYAAKQYDISMNCAQSSLEITHHISDELTILMRDNFGVDILSNRETLKSR